MIQQIIDGLVSEFKDETGVDGLCAGVNVVIGSQVEPQPTSSSPLLQVLFRAEQVNMLAGYGSPMCFEYQVEFDLVLKTTAAAPEGINQLLKLWFSIIPADGGIRGSGVRLVLNRLCSSGLNVQGLNLMVRAQSTTPIVQRNSPYTYILRCPISVGMRLGG